MAPATGDDAFAKVTPLALVSAMMGVAAATAVEETLKVTVFVAVTPLALAVATTAVHVPAARFGVSRNWPLQLAQVSKVPTKLAVPVALVPW